MKDLEDWQVIALCGDLIAKLEDLPSPETDAAWEERQNIHRWLLDYRKTFVDRAYELYVENYRKPWCDVCGGSIVLSEFHGWRHVGFEDGSHEIATHEYAAGCEAEIIKRLKFEI